MAVILVVDDDNDSRWMLRALMAREGSTRAIDAMKSTRRRASMSSTISQADLRM